MENGRRHIPNSLRLHRKKMRYSQKQVATFLGLHMAQISHWENGLKVPSGLNLIKLSVIYGTHPGEFYIEHYQEFREQLNAKRWEIFT